MVVRGSRELWWREAADPGDSPPSPDLLPGLPTGQTPWKPEDPEAGLVVYTLGQEAGWRRMENGTGAKRKLSGKVPRFLFLWRAGGRMDSYPSHPALQPPCWVSAF